MVSNNSINSSTAGIVGNTGTAFTGTAATQYNVIVGGSTTSTLSNVAPSATSGIPLVSGGSSANPSFTTAVVAGGGTGVTTMTTAYAPVCAGTSATGALQVASTGLGTSGFVLTSTGSSSLPSFQTVSASGAVTTIAADSGSCTPSSGSVTISGGTTGLTTSASSHTLNITGTLHLANGGTNANLTASNGGIFYSTASAGAILGGTATARQVLLSGSSTTPAWSTATYPATATANQILYASSSNVIGQITSAANGILNTDGSSVPSIATSPSISGTYTTTGGNFALPSTNAGLTAGCISVNGTNYVSFFGNTDVFIGPLCGNGTLSGQELFGLGYSCFHSVTSATKSAAIGSSALQAVTSSSNNNAHGYNALASLTTGGGFNISMGDNCLSSLATGAYNTGLGYLAGSGYTSSESSNICIMANGVAAESNTLRIGTSGTGNGQVSTCYIAGISGVTVTGTAVLCSATGQLGTVASSIRYKENVSDLKDESSAIYKLNPVKFNYKSDKTKTEQYGLIAEEVHKAFPYLCFYGKEGEPESVKYHELPILLLAEMKKMAHKIKILEDKIK